MLFWEKGVWMGKVIVTAAVSILLLAVAWTDFKTMEIPDILFVFLGICALTSVKVFPEIPISERLTGAVCISAPMYLLCRFMKDAFGEGDILLLLIMGFYLGWKALFAGTLLGFLFGGIEACFLLSTGKVKFGEHAHMAFGPALCAGLFLAQFCSQELISWYVSFFIIVQ